jgi:hypothetical protein
MKNLLPYCLILSLLVSSSCSTVLYQPNTVNFPTVDTIHNKEVKLTFNLHSTDIHFNSLNNKNGILFQAQANVTPLINRELETLKPRLGLGLGKMWLNNDYRPFLSMQLATSGHHNYAGYESDFLDLLMANGDNWGLKMSGRQWHTGLLFGGQYHLGKIRFISSIFIDYNYSRNYEVIASISYEETGEKYVKKYNRQNFNYLMGSVQTQIFFANYFQIVIGMKSPIYFNQSQHISSLNYTSEGFYIRFCTRLGF